MLALISIREVLVRNPTAAIFLSISITLPASAMGLQIICPPLVRDGIAEFAYSYTQKTGVPVNVKADVMGKIMRDIKTGTADVILLPSGLMDELSKDGGVKAAMRHKVGRVEIALAVRPGSPHPDISTVSKFSSALKSAATVAYTKPGPPRNSMEAAIIDHILHESQFSGVHLMTVATGSGVAALAKGGADMALQVTPEIISRRDVELVGPLPPQLGAHIDVDAAVSAGSPDPRVASDFIRYISRLDAAQDWKKFGLDR